MEGKERKTVLQTQKYWEENLWWLLFWFLKTVRQYFKAKNDIDTLQPSQNTATARDDKRIYKTLNALIDISESCSNPTLMNHHNTNCHQCNANWIMRLLAEGNVTDKQEVTRSGRKLLFSLFS